MVFYDLRFHSIDCEFQAGLGLRWPVSVRCDHLEDCSRPQEISKELGVVCLNLVEIFICSVQFLF